MQCAAEDLGIIGNEIFCALSERSVDEQRVVELYEAFGLLGQYPDEINVEFAFVAQSEVALSD